MTPWYLAAVAAMVLVCGCQMDDQTDSETHWQQALHACEQDSECAPGLSCECGICTETCATAEDVCSEMSERATCAEASSEIASVCGEKAAAPSSLCANDCVEDAHCPDGQICNSSFCRPPAENSNPGAEEQEPWDGSEIRGWSCGVPGLPSCCPRAYYSLGEMHTSFSFVLPPDPNGLQVDETAMDHRVTATWSGVTETSAGDGSEISFTSPDFTVPLGISRDEVEVLAEHGDAVEVEWRTDEISRDYLRIYGPNDELLLDFTRSNGDVGISDASIQLARDEYTLRTEPVADDLSNARCTTENNRCDNFYVIQQIILDHNGNTSRVAPGVQYDFEAQEGRFRLRHFMTVQRPPQSLGCAIGEQLGFNYLVTRLPN